MIACCLKLIKEPPPHCSRCSPWSVAKGDKLSLLPSCRRVPGKGEDDDGGRKTAEITSYHKNSSSSERKQQQHEGCMLWQGCAEEKKQLFYKVEFSSMSFLSFAGHQWEPGELQRVTSSEEAPQKLLTVHCGKTLEWESVGEKICIIETGNEKLV